MTIDVERSRAPQLGRHVIGGSRAALQVPLWESWGQRTTLQFDPKSMTWLYPKV